MVERRKPITVHEAIENTMKFARTGSVHHVPIEECQGRFLGEDLIADHNVPPFDRSPYDGFAVRAEDTETASSGNPITFSVIGGIGAGSIFTNTVENMQAVRIMTGAQIPEGTNAVLSFESVEEKMEKGKAGFVVHQPVQPGDNIVFIGEDTTKGSTLVQKGTYITSGIVALLATFGYQRVPVSEQPKVGIIATGSELLDIAEELQPGKIRNSNAYMVHAQVERAGGKATYLGKFEDDVNTCYIQMSSALEQVDILITTGGVSVGDFDYLPDIYERMGANVLFNKVAMRPGSVTTIAEKDGKLLFGLSGNPSACYVGFELFCRPIIRHYLHSTEPFLNRIHATLGVDFLKTNVVDRFVRGYLSYKDGEVIAIPDGLDKSNAISSLAKANVLIWLPKGTEGYKEGSKVEALMLEDQDGMTWTAFSEA